MYYKKDAAASYLQLTTKQFNVVIYYEFLKGCTVNEETVYSEGELDQFAINILLPMKDIFNLPN